MAFDTKYAIGYDLNDVCVQMSYCSLKDLNPETFSTIAGEQNYNIPTVLCKKNEVNQWFFGVEAEKVLAYDAGIKIEHLLEQSRKGEMIQIESEEYDPTALLALFMKRTLHLLDIVMSVENIEALMITVDNLDEATLLVLGKIAPELPVPIEKIYVQSYAESIYFYILNQPEELWKQRVMVFDYAYRGLSVYGMHINERTQPVVAFMDENYFLDFKSPEEMYPNMSESDRDLRMDEKMLQTMKECIDRYVISSVYLIGDGFEGDYLKKTLKYLCMGRRVFQGKNLYTKGAAHSAMEKIVPGSYSSTHIFLGKDKLKSNFGVKVMSGAEETYVALVDAGVNWYEATAKYDFILAAEPVVPVIVTPLDGKDVRTVEIELLGLPIRPAKATRISLKISFKSEHHALIRIYDMGFGEMYPSSGKVWEQEIEI